MIYPIFREIKKCRTLIEINHAVSEIYSPLNTETPAKPINTPHRTYCDKHSSGHESPGCTRGNSVICCNENRTETEEL